MRGGGLLYSIILLGHCSDGLGGRIKLGGWYIEVEGFITEELTESLIEKTDH